MTKTEMMVGSDARVNSEVGAGRLRSTNGQSTTFVDPDLSLRKQALLRKADGRVKTEQKPSGNYRDRVCVIIQSTAPLRYYSTMNASIQCAGDILSRGAARRCSADEVASPSSSSRKWNCTIIWYAWHSHSIRFRP